MSTRLLVPLVAVLLLAGCDRITGEADKKMLDAQAVGYACRVSMKTPEDCMKENETQSPTFILNGWKSADQDINERVLDPTMGKRAAKADAKPAVTQTGEGKAAQSGEGKSVQPAESKAAQPGEGKAGQPDKKPATSGH